MPLGLRGICLIKSPLTPLWKRGGLNGYVESIFDYPRISVKLAKMGEL